MIKSTGAEIELRIMTVIEMIIKGQSRQDIIRYGSDTWGISDRQIDDYLKKAKDKIAEDSSELIKNQLDVSIIRYNDLYKKSYNIQDYRECRQIVGDIIKTFGLRNASPKEEIEPKKVGNGNVLPMKKKF